MLDEPIVLTDREIRELQMAPPVAPASVAAPIQQPIQSVPPIQTPPPPPPVMPAPVVEPAPLSASGYLSMEPVSLPVPPVSAPSFHVVAPVTPPAQPSMPSLTPVVSGRLPKTKPLALLGIAILCVVIFGGVAYAYVRQIGPFGVSQYTEATFLTNILAKASVINTASYKFSAGLTMPARDKDALPYAAVAPSDEKVAQYDHDVRRVSDVSSLVSSLSYGYGEQSVYDYKTKTYSIRPGKSYPTTLEAVAKTGYMSGSTRDPITAQPYEYIITEGGNNFAITTTLETDDAINAIRTGYDYAATSTIVTGKRVTFTKHSRYVYLSSSLPEPFLVSFSDSLRSIPPDVSGSVSIGASTDLSKEGLPDWRFNATAIGDMGDLSYKVDVEARKKDANYYVRINNIPSIIPYLGSYKGKWIEITPKAATTTKNDDFSYHFDPFSEIATTIADTEKDYKAERIELAKELRSLAELADEVKLVAFKENPIREKVDGRDLYRYKLTIRKESIVPFYMKVLDDPVKFKKLHLAKDDGLLDYLKSSEFEKTFDYVNTNTQLTFWTDTAGFPAKVEYRLRIVPPETAVQLKEKQIVLVFSLDLSDINEKVNIEKPADARPIEDVIKEIDGNTGSSLSTARQKGTEASIKSNLDTIRTQAEIYFDSENTYGTQSWTSGAAIRCSGGLYKDKNIANSLVAVDNANADVGGVACYANGKAYLVGATLNTKEWWCVDSTGASRKEFGALPTTLPSGGKCL
jgi:hypothetical protein